MIEQEALGDIPIPDGADPRVAALEERVRQLEQVVAALQDTRALEERVVERVSAQVKPAPSAGVRESAGLLLQAGRHLLPAAVSVLSESAAPAEAPAPAAVPPTPAAAPAARQPWLLFSVYAEFRAILRMYLDPRFRLSWQGRLAPLILLPAIALSWFWLPGTAVLSALPFGIDRLYVKIVDLLLAFVLFHVLHREATRYRTTSPDLPPSLRL
jgi:hypothetical protein